MSIKIYELAPAAWDVGSFLENLKSKGEEWGGLALMFFGVVLLLAFAFKLGTKLLANQQNQGQQASWMTIGLLLLFGGALTTGGWNLISEVGSGGQQTVEDLGTGTVVVQSVDDTRSVLPQAIDWT